MREHTRDFLQFAQARGAPLFRTACLLTGDWHLAEDLVQETLAKMYQSWPKIARIESPVAYSNTVLVRTFVSQRRKRSSSERPVEAVPESVHRSTGNRESDPALRLTLLDALASLSPKDRAVLVLRYWEDRSIEETAEMLGLSIAAVKTQAHRALRRLRTALGDELPDLALS